MKLVWQDGLETLSRSMKGVTGRPLSFSVSLCKTTKLENETFQQMFSSLWWKIHQLSATCHRKDLKPAKNQL